uniref:Uncharacterized protein n=1 Tax=Candidatus Kentrum sp. TUN TaxID=2126343 RepID=A0A450ZN59_9GAMM|nr:MAG: hypothetical protein BECKTUN1418F_GA0071002_10661 [Candidatus Kentron sp. TUN]
MTQPFQGWLRSPCRPRVALQQPWADIRSPFVIQIRRMNRDKKPICPHGLSLRPALFVQRLLYFLHEMTVIAPLPGESIRRGCTHQ